MLHTQTCMHTCALVCGTWASCMHAVQASTQVSCVHACMRDAGLDAGCILVLFDYFNYSLGQVFCIVACTDFNTDMVRDPGS